MARSERHRLKGGCDMSQGVEYTWKAGISEEWH
jgi:hypothetical protein